MSTVRYSGMNASSGHAITDNEHIAQSIGDILLTPIGSRVMRRAYGSQLFNL
ncbi:baseplate assembly protein, partial [Salmonella enterica subsp. enterica serovar Weltevreden]|nr:baseplate assembly protein [Salmonella enterica subsp. enterica serovar Weltevreden]